MFLLRKCCVQVVAKYLAAVEEQLEGGSPPVLSSLQVGQGVVARRGRGWFGGGGAWAGAGAGSDSGSGHGHWDSCI